MSDHKELCALLRELCDDLGIDAADLIEQQAARIAELEGALVKAAQLAEIASDWDLPEVELYDGWISTDALAVEFNRLLKG